MVKLQFANMHTLITADFDVHRHVYFQYLHVTLCIATTNIKNRTLLHAVTCIGLEGWHSREDS